MKRDEATLLKMKLTEIVNDFKAIIAFYLTQLWISNLKFSLFLV
ncbi:hypothetical protein SAMN04488131_12423 [Flavobacterium xueshanense]|uniref:Uncharacterized protein n=1 Tax=Flavobacterium xueshanense TaxID=935223 RepID=A0A1I2IXW3_9FLAO|nr:hypothetical protein SAMN04488131_12423 [Flavobacterium xueshanense]